MRARGLHTNLYQLFRDMKQETSVEAGKNVLSVTIHPHVELAGLEDRSEVKSSSNGCVSTRGEADEAMAVTIFGI